MDPLLPPTLHHPSPFHLFSPSPQPPLAFSQPLLSPPFSSSSPSFLCWFPSIYCPDHNGSFLFSFRLNSFTNTNAMHAIIPIVIMTAIMTVVVAAAATRKSLLGCLSADSLTDSHYHHCTTTITTLFFFFSFVLLSLSLQY